MNDFLLECTDGESLPGSGSVDGGNSSGNKLGVLSKREIEDFFQDTSSSSSYSSSSSCPSCSSSPAPGQQQQHRHPNRRGSWGGGEARGTPSRESGGSARGGTGEGRVVRAKKSRSSRERLSPLPPHMGSLPKEDQRCERAGGVRDRAVLVPRLFSETQIDKQGLQTFSRLQARSARDKNCFQWGCCSLL